MKKYIFILVFILSFPCLNILNAQTISTVAGNYYYQAGYSGNGGQATLAELNGPTGVALDKQGNLYIVDDNNSVVREVNYPTGIISTFIGNGIPSYGGDGGPASSAELRNPWGISIDKSGNFYISDANNYVVRKVDYFSGIINTIAGNNMTGYGGDGGPATSAELYDVTNAAIDDSNNIIIADISNNLIRKVNKLTGIINTIAGQYPGGYYSGNGGPATSATFWVPAGVALDDSGNVYISDANNNVIRKVNHLSGIISTVVGNGYEAGMGGGYSGDGGPATNAELYLPMNVCFDTLGNMYISDYYNFVIRRVDKLTGIIRTVVGNAFNAGAGQGGYSGDGGPATSAELNFPTCVAFDSHGNMFIADSYNNVIREVTGLTGIDEITDKNQLNVYPNPSNGIFTIQWSVVSGQWSVEVFNVVGEKVYFTPFHLPPSGGSASASFQINLSSQPNGIYFVRIESEKGSLCAKVVIEE